MGKEKKRGARTGNRRSLDQAARKRGSPNQSKPEERKRATGSVTGTGSRLKNQRATANPNAAKQT
jgi:hypothetical protein